MRPATDGTADDVLEIRDLGVSYGGVRAVDGVDLSVAPGHLTGLIGPNGAGKTSLIDGITGFVPATGRVTFCGESVESLRPHVRARRGLVRTFQSVELFDDLTVLENLLVATERRSPWETVRDAVAPRRDAAAARGALASVGMEGAAERAVAELPLGQRKLVSIARALARRPRLLLLDEPAAGLDNNESLALGDRLQALVAGGLTILLVDHDMHLVLGICTDVYVLDFGRIITHGPRRVSPASRRVVGSSAADGGEHVVEDRREAVALGVVERREGRRH